MAKTERADTTGRTDRTQSQNERCFYNNYNSMKKNIKYNSLIAVTEDNKQQLCGYFVKLGRATFHYVQFSPHKKRLLNY